MVFPTIYNLPYNLTKYILTIKNLPYNKFKLFKMTILIVAFPTFSYENPLFHH